jgi:hypothetical protein
MLGQKTAPVLERPVARDAERSSFIGRGHEPEQELGPDIVERREAELVDDHEVGPQQTLDQPADAVVGQTAIERLHECCRSEVADSLARSNGSFTEADQAVTLSGSRRSNQDQVFVSGDPLERREIVECRLRDRALDDLELLERLDTGNAAARRRPASPA